MNDCKESPAAVLSPAERASSADLNCDVRLLSVPCARSKLLTKPVRSRICSAAPLTCTVKLHTSRLLDASVAVQPTVVVPIGNVEPEGGIQLMLTPGQLSLAVGAGKM